MKGVIFKLAQEVVTETYGEDTNAVPEIAVTAAECTGTRLADVETSLTC